MTNLAPPTTSSRALPSQRRTPSRTRKPARAAISRADQSTADATRGMLSAEGPEAPGSWDELASKLDRKFRALLKSVEDMQAELEDENERARQLENRLRREVIGNG